MRRIHLHAYVTMSICRLLTKIIYKNTQGYITTNKYSANFSFHKRKYGKYMCVFAEMLVDCSFICKNEILIILLYILVLGNTYPRATFKPHQNFLSLCNLKQTLYQCVCVMLSVIGTVYHVFQVYIFTCLFCQY